MQVSSTASPSFVASNSGSTGAAASSSTSTGASTTGNTGKQLHRQHRGLGTGSSFAGNTGSGGSSPGGQHRHRLAAVSPQTSTVGATFKGIGAALILLGLLAAAALAYLYKRADDMTEPSAPPVRTGTPSWSASRATPDELSDFGGFG